MQFNQLGSHRFARMMAGVTTAAVLAFAPIGGAALAQSGTSLERSMPDFTQVVEQTEASVVNIRTTETVRVRNRMGPSGNDPYEMFRWFFGPDFMPNLPGHPRSERDSQPAEQERTVPRGVGSGFIISADGFILTNNHVISGSSDIFVTLTDGKEHRAKVVGTDARTDLALLKIDAKGLKPLPIGESSSLRKGQWVLAIGSPFGLESTVTAGIVSALNRETGDYLPFIQTDVAVNPGNSGGPLIDLSGRVVGVNSQIVSRSGGFMGISLAIPIDEAMRVVEQLKDHGKVTRGRIGVQIGTVSEEVAKAIGLPKAMGAMVSNVERGGPADKAGVRSGDVITRFDGRDINHMSDLPRLVGDTKPGTRASMELWRKGKTVTVKVMVGEMPSTDEDQARPSDKQEAVPADALGLTVGEVSAAARAQYQFEGGVEVTEVEGPAAEAGLSRGDIVLTINDTDISSPAQYASVVSKLDKSRPAAVLVMRGDQSQWVTITPRK
ncbi:DegQ family serine endoprotease [Achromobacter sp. F4_2707]|uniref:DegQ family serine endoprotease n=1 Tax=Achromobacter sp. F4_2707 TaxID=3114286 RepID=UPI0039C6DB79